MSKKKVCSYPSEPVYKYNVKIKKYRNSVDGDLYNISYSRPSNRPPRKTNSQKLQTVIDRKIVERWVRLSNPGSKHIRYSYICPCSPTYRLTDVFSGQRQYKRDRSNVLRAIREIRDVGLSNDWDYFATFTLSPDLHDRTDFQGAAKKLTQYFRDLRKQDHEIEYLIVPEEHRRKILVPKRDGNHVTNQDFKNAMYELLNDPVQCEELEKAWNIGDPNVRQMYEWKSTYHFHALLKGDFDGLVCDHEKIWLRNKGYKNWPQVEKKFGFCSLSPIRTKEKGNAVVFYVLKYVNKQFSRSEWNMGVHLYYVSRGCSRPKCTRSYTTPESVGFLENNLYYTQYNTAYARQLTDEQLFYIEMNSLFGDSYSQQVFEKENES